MEAVKNESESARYSLNRVCRTDMQIRGGEAGRIGSDNAFNLEHLLRVSKHVADKTGLRSSVNVDEHMSEIFLFPVDARRTPMHAKGNRVTSSPSLPCSRTGRPRHSTPWIDMRQERHRSVWYYCRYRQTKPCACGQAEALRNVAVYIPSRRGCWSRVNHQREARTKRFTRDQDRQTCGLR